MSKRIQLSDHFTYGRLMRFVFPSIIMMVFTSIYTVVDGFFVSNFAGKTAFAGLNLIVPFIMILGGLGFMVGAGGSALVAMTLGQGDDEKANRYFTMMIWVVLILGLVTAVIGIPFAPQVARFLGAEGDMVEHCVRYARICLAFNGAFMMQNLFQSFLITAEKPKMGLWVTVAAGITNMIGDALLVGVFRWGVSGAALATGLSQAVGGFLPLFYFMRKNDSRLRLVKTRLEWKPIMKACGNGASELVNNIASSIVGILYNYQLLHYYGENGVSAYGVLMYVQFMFVAIFIGYSIGCAPIVGFNYGAENTDEMKNVFRKSMILMSTLGLAMMIVAFGSAGMFAKIFVGYDEELMHLTKHAFHLCAMTYLFAGINIYSSSFFTALNNGKVSAVISFLRTLVFQTGSILLLPLMFGGDMVWFAQPIAEVLAFITIVYALITNRSQYHYF